MSEDLFDLYYEFLGNIEIGKLKECVDIIIKEKKWFPKVSEFNEILHPESNPESDYIRYLEKSTKERLSELKQLELKKENLSEEVKERIKKIIESIDRDINNPVLEGEKAERFERKRIKAKEKVKGLLN